MNCYCGLFGAGIDGNDVTRYNITNNEYTSYGNNITYNTASNNLRKDISTHYNIPFNYADVTSVNKYGTTQRLSANNTSEPATLPIMY
jgi:hypothetical protein